MENVIDHFSILWMSSLTLSAHHFIHTAIAFFLSSDVFAQMACHQPLRRFRELAAFLRYMIGRSERSPPYTPAASNTQSVACVL